MHALRIHEFGDPAEVLRLEELVLPELAEGQVRLKMLASPINPADLNLIQGTYGVKPSLPVVAGIEGCGEVVESRAPGYEPGDRCIFLRRADLWASHVQVPASHLFKLPAGIDPRQAAMLKVNPATAWRLLTGFGDLPRGSWILQNAANSGVGRAVIRLAPLLGIRTINVVRRAELIPQMLMLGADHVLLDDEEAVESVQAICGRIPPLLAFNAVGGESALRQLKSLAAGGTHITYGAMSRRPLTVPNGVLIFKEPRIRGLWITKWIESASRAELEEVYGKLADMMLAGGLNVPLASTHPLADFKSALDRVADPVRNGKVLFVS